MELLLFLILMALYFVHKTLHECLTQLKQIRHTLQQAATSATAYDG